MLPMKEAEIMDETTPDRPVRLSLNGIGKSFTAKGRQVDAVRDLDLNVYDGEYVVILGPSGCGKSTLVRCIAGLESPTSGTISVAGKTICDAGRGVNTSIHKRDIGMVFQNYALWPHMSVEKNVAYPLKRRRVAKEDRASRVREVLEALECAHLAKRLPAELSGGQQQRIALARALVYQPGLLLLDEPLSNLDALLRVSLRSELLRLHRSLRYTGLHITHDQEEALEMGDRVVLMREGRIEQIGPPEEVYGRPVSPYAANFLGVRNRVKVSHRSGKLEHEQGIVEGSGALTAKLRESSDQLELFVRARDTHVYRGTPDFTRSLGELTVQGTIAQIVLGDGGRRQYVVDIGGRLWYAQHADSDGLSAGEEVHVSIPATRALLYQGENLVSQ
ncbi:sn-glycerol-3-phosphate import ATP-binding protein UgpC [Amycolatopsis sp. M39]|nr:sn-glycerol-3-phosphate import ATP-binding protein UgpC [Amycolatopsis sp. M39]